MIYPGCTRDRAIKVWIPRIWSQDGNYWLEKIIMYNIRNTSGFTLVEMIIATVIFATMSLMVMSIYIQTTSISSRLKATRYLSESAREITERIWEDVRTLGITGSTAEYTGSGTDKLLIWTGGIQYLHGMKTNIWIDLCTSTIKKCGLYRVIGTDYVWAWNLVDSFVPEEDKKRVQVEDMRFFISWDGESTEKKVTLVFTLALKPRIGIPGVDASDSKLRIQTTISEKYYK